MASESCTALSPGVGPEPVLFIPWAHSKCVGSRGSLLQSQDVAGALPGDWGAVDRRASTEQTWELGAMPESHSLQASSFHTGFSGVWDV